MPKLKISMRRDPIKPLWRIETPEGRQTYVGDIIIDGAPARTLTSKDSGGSGWLMVDGVFTVDGPENEMGSIATIRPEIDSI